MRREWAFIILVLTNHSLATVNFFMGCVGVIQLTRIFISGRSSDSVAAIAEDIKADVKENVPTPIKESTSS